MASKVTSADSFDFRNTTPETPPTASPLRALQPTLRSFSAVRTSSATSPRRTMFLSARSMVRMKRLGTRNVRKADVSWL